MTKSNKLKILAFDTSTEFCSAALWLDGTIHYKEILAGRRHSELLLPMLSEMLAETELALSQLDVIAFGAGPGSFTGLRIACGVAQGLAFAADLPVIGISTLETMAKKVDEHKIIVALDARMDEIYHAAYIKLTDAWETISAPILCYPHHSPLVSGDDWIGCGSGFDNYNKELSTHYNGNILSIRQGIYPHAKEMVQLAASKFTDGLYIDPIYASPIYIRNKVALKESER